MEDLTEFVGAKAFSKRFHLWFDYLELQALSPPDVRVLSSHHIVALSLQVENNEHPIDEEILVKQPLEHDLCLSLVHEMELCIFEVSVPVDVLQAYFVVRKCREVGCVFPALLSFLEG